MFYERVQELCQKRGKKLTPLLLELGMSSSATGRWQEGKLPNGESLIKLAEILEVSTDYLLGLSDENRYYNASLSNSAVMNGHNSTAINGISKDESDILKIYREFDIEKRVKFLNYLVEIKNN
jgi:transcriptional regulator with XRE-family HTH domain